MVSLNKEITVNFNKLMDFLFPKHEKYINEKILFYIRVYTDLISAQVNISKIHYKRATNYLKVVRNMCRGHQFKEEELYIKRIYEIVNGILANIRCVRCRAKDCDVCNPAHARTKLQLAQNICILRILKRREKA